MTDEEREALERELRAMRQTIRQIWELAARLDTAAEAAIKVLKENDPNEQ